MEHDNKHPQAPGTHRRSRVVLLADGQCLVVVLQRLGKALASRLEQRCDTTRQRTTGELHIATEVSPHVRTKVAKALRHLLNSDNWVPPSNL